MPSQIVLADGSAPAEVYAAHILSQYLSALAFPAEGRVRVVDLATAAGR